MTKRSKSPSPFAGALAVTVPSASLRCVQLKQINTRGVQLPSKSDPKVIALVESIGEVGQLVPVLVDADLKLISGRHRYVALTVLKRDEIDVKVADLDELGTRLARIDENLVRQTFTALERAEQLEERQRIYEAMHPQAKHGGAPGKKGGGKSKDATVAGFAKDTASKTGTSERTVQLYVQAAKRLDPEAKKLIAKTPAAESITELSKLSKLDAEQQRQVAAMVSASPEKTSVKGAVKQLRKEKALKNVLEYRPPVDRYAVIVADPSWKFDDDLDGSDEARGGVAYPPQTEEEICAMEVGKNNAAPDCALWLWVTNTHLINGAASRVLAAWGFVGKALYTWRKVDSKGNLRLGSGHYGMGCTEHVILAVRGKPVVNGAGVPNIFDAPRTSRHSQKPDRFFEIAAKVTPCAPEARIELNAIEERKGWVTSGSEQQAAQRRERGAEHPKRSDPPAEKEEEDVSAPAVVIEWVAQKKPGVLVAGEGGGFKFRIERVRSKTAQQGFMWTGWPEKGRTGRVSSHPAVFASVDDAKLDALEAAVAARLTGELPRRLSTTPADGAAPDTGYIDRLMDRGWEPSPNGYAKKIDGLFWFIEPINGRDGWQAHRPKQGEVRARSAEDFATTDAAMEWVESVAPGAAELPTEPIDDGTLCGARPSKTGEGCIHKQGHVGVHSNGRTTWRDRKGKLPAIEDVPSASESREPDIIDPNPLAGIPFDAIRWKDKKHPVKAAVGVADSGRRYAIDRVKKSGRTAFRWFCISDRSSSLDDFETIDRAKANAGAAEQDWLRAKAGAA